MTQKHTDFCGGQEFSPTLLTLQGYKEKPLLPCLHQKKACVKPASFSMIYWKQQLILIKPSQNIKLTEPTAVVGIHNSWSKSFKTFILTDFLSGFENFFPFYTFILILKSLTQSKKRFLNLWSKVLNYKVSQFKKNNKPDNIQLKQCTH